MGTGNFSDDFKRDAVAQITERGYAIKEVSERLAVSLHSLYAWKRKFANPPFNISDWGGERLREDARWKYGLPPAGNANFAWLQHILHHLAPTGTAGVVLANGAMSSTQSGEGEMRRAMIEGEVVDCMIALPEQLFYSTQIPACL